MRGFKMRQSGNKVGAKNNIFKSGLAFIRKNSSQCFIIPSVYFPKHNMIQRNIAACIEWPIFVKSGGSVHYPPAPRREGLLRCHFVCQLCVSVFAQCVQDGLVPSNPTSMCLLSCSTRRARLSATLLLSSSGTKFQYRATLNSVCRPLP